MTGSFLARHRTICAVLTEIKIINNQEEHPNLLINALCDEAIDYAQRMSAKLVEYSNAKKNTHE